MERILHLLRQAGIAEYTVCRHTERSAELFFVKKQLDTRRIKDVEKYYVTVYRTAEKDGKPLRASTNETLLASMSDEEILSALKSAYFAAQFAMNPGYALPEPTCAPLVEQHGPLAEDAPEQSAGVLAEALFAADRAEGAFLNSAEIFVVQSRYHVAASTGTDVSWTQARAEGEYVVQATEPEDVEMHRQFAFDTLEPEALKRQVGEALRFVRDRAGAQRILKSGSYDVILTGENAETLLEFYSARSSAQMIFPGYSAWQVGEDVQPEASGERISITLRATAPYSAEGIPMKDLPLLQDGRLMQVHGPTRFCRYLGAEPTGEYRKFSCDNPGTLSFAEMQQRPCLWAVTFSDFQTDFFSGHFGGELRLGYLMTDGKLIPVTGGSINGSILEAQKDLCFSTDRFTSATYAGPYAVRLKNVRVAGV